MRAFIPPCRTVYKSATNTVTYSLSLCADYSKMFELKDALGRKLFESIAITLVCDECMKTETPEKCTHKLAEMPRWLSSAKMEVVKKLLEDDPVPFTFRTHAHVYVASIGWFSLDSFASEVLLFHEHLAAAQQDDVLWLWHGLQICSFSIVLFCCL